MPNIENGFKGQCFKSKLWLAWHLAYMHTLGGAREQLLGKYDVAEILNTRICSLRKEQ